MAWEVGDIEIDKQNGRAWLSYTNRNGTDQINGAVITNQDRRIFYAYNYKINDWEKEGIDLNEYNIPKEMDQTLDTMYAKTSESKTSESNVNLNNQSIAEDYTKDSVEESWTSNSHRQPSVVRPTYKFVSISCRSYDDMYNANLELRDRVNDQNKMIEILVPKATQLPVGYVSDLDGHGTTLYQNTQALDAIKKAMDTIDLISTSNPTITVTEADQYVQKNLKPEFQRTLIGVLLHDVAIKANDVDTLKTQDLGIITDKLIEALAEAKLTLLQDSSKPYLKQQVEIHKISQKIKELNSQQNELETKLMTIPKPSYTSQRINSSIKDLKTTQAMYEKQESELKRDSKEYAEKIRAMLSDDEKAKWTANMKTIEVLAKEVGDNELSKNPLKRMTGKTVNSKIEGLALSHTQPESKTQSFAERLSNLSQIIVETWLQCTSREIVTQLKVVKAFQSTLQIQAQMGEDKTVGKKIVLNKAATGEVNRIGKILKGKVKNAKPRNIREDLNKIKKIIKTNQRDLS